MALILCIETSTTVCSVALFKQNQLVACREINNGYTHAENLHVFIKEVLNESKISPKEINAIAVGKGPGSYTGLRIGVSAAKGMAYALNIPLISMNSLRNLVEGVKAEINDENCVVAPMLDARRMEVYMGIFEKCGSELEATSSFIISDSSLNEKFSSFNKVYLFGDGAEKCRPFLSTFPQLEIIPNKMPSANNMGNYCVNALNENNTEDTAYFEPFYLKEFFTGKQ
jgi:tRNA threonylcarbamoyladenosine biosynthesis protein TsaB